MIYCMECGDSLERGHGGQIIGCVHLLETVCENNDDVSILDDDSWLDELISDLS